MRRCGFLQVFWAQCCLVLLCLACPAVAWGQSVITVAAAASVKAPLEVLAREFEQRTGHVVRLVYGSSTQLVTQIMQGAPFELLLSADEESVTRLVRAGFAQGLGHPYAIGRLVLYLPHGSVLKLDASLQDLKAALTDGRLHRFSIANPTHAPYGMRAKEVLTHAGLWSAIEKRLVWGENVAQAAAFASSGAAQGGIIALSLALTPELSARGTWVELPKAWHHTLRQRLVLTNRASPGAAAFQTHILSTASRPVWTRFGFDLP